MQEATQKGLLTELQCITDFTQNRILVSQPIINDSRYDFVADIDGTLYRIQCKTAIVSEDGSSISFYCKNRNWNNGETKNYKGDIDFFYTCYNGQGYLIPIEETGTVSKTLRFVPPKNGNTNWCNAHDYEIDTMIVKLGGELNKTQNSISYLGGKERNYCIDCGKPVSRNAIRCHECNLTFHKSKIKPSREVLKELIFTEPFTKIASSFGVSDNAVRKWCDSYNLPRKRVDINKYTREEWDKI